MKHFDVLIVEMNDLAICLVVIGVVNGLIIIGYLIKRCLARKTDHTNRAVAPSDYVSLQ